MSNKPILAPSDTWFTQGGTSVKRTSITEIHIVDSYTPAGAVTDSWDASAAKDGSIMVYVEGAKLTIAGNGTGGLFANPNSGWVFSDSGKADYFSNVTNIFGGNLLDTSKATNMERMFRDCRSLITVDTGNWDTRNVGNMVGMFMRCVELAQINVTNWDTGNVTGFSSMFYMNPANNKLVSINVGNWNTSKATNMSQMFGGCKALKTIGNTNNWDTSSVTNMFQMFSWCVSLTNIGAYNWDTSACADMGEMFDQMPGLKQITVGAKFSFNGNGATSCVLPTPPSGYWYTKDGTAYEPAYIPNNKAAVYFAEKPPAISRSAAFLLSRMFSKPVFHAITGKWFWWEVGED